MKMFFCNLPEKMAAHFAKWTFENGHRVMLSYSKDEFFDGMRVVAYVAVEDEKIAAFTTEFKNYVKQL